MNVYLGGKRIRLDPRRTLGQGGEADVFAVGGRALKIFKTPDHPDYQGQPLEQRAAEERIARHQRKLREFPVGLPSPVVVPQELATDRSGHLVVGYAMALVAPAEPLLRYADPLFRRAGVPGRAVVELFLDLHVTLAGLHQRGVVVGDLNDLNILVTPDHRGHFIDADSYAFGGHPCTVFTERFLDPLLCDANAGAPRLTRPYTVDADWYAFAALLMQSLLLVGPYGGIFRPRQASQRLPPAARPLRRITVFHPEVVYPRPATSYRVLPDNWLDQLQRIFERDERGPFPRRLLEELELQRCPSCGVEHARLACPLCHPSAALRPTETVRVRGEVRCTTVFRTAGVIVHAAVEDGTLRLVHHEGGAYRREDGAPVLEAELDPRLRWRTLGARTLIGCGGELVVLAPGAAPERIPCDSDGRAPAFATNGRHRYWIAAGLLLRDATPLLALSGRPRGDDGGSAASRATARGGAAPDTTAPAWGATVAIGEVLTGQTRIWAGPAFGLGLYRASRLAVAFTFDAERRGINDSLPLPPLPGQLLDAHCVLDRQRAWLLLALHHGGRTRHLCLVYSRGGALEGTAEAAAGDGSWLGILRGACATDGVLLAATDAGMVRVELEGGTARPTRAFPDSEPFVATDRQLLAGRDGLYVVGRREIVALRMS